jgi:hypothetical protein
MANRTCTYRVDDLASTGDTLYGSRIRAQAFVDYAWAAHGFNKDYWLDGWGWDDCCNIRKPLARVFNAMWLLGYSAADWENEDWSATMLNWAPRYVREQFSHYGDLRAGCGNGSSNVRTTRRGWGRPYVTLFLSFFYANSGSDARDVLARAAALVHEARHIGDKPHDAEFPPGSVFGSGSGADSSWEHEGAFMYEALYLWWFYAAGTRATIALRQSARLRANVIINNALARHPGFVAS